MSGYINPKIAVFLTALLLILTGCSSPKLLPLTDDAVIVAFGDSLTAGYGVNKSDSYPMVLQEITGLKVINSGVSGETTSEGLERLSDVLNKHQPDLVVLLEGGNDLLQKKKPQQIKQNLRSMIQIIQASGAQVLMVGVPEKKLFGSSLPLYSELSSELGVPLEEDIVASLMKRPSMKSDFVHFNKKGYKELAMAIFEKLQQAGAI